MSYGLEVKFKRSTSLGYGHQTVDMLEKPNPIRYGCRRKRPRGVSRALVAPETSVAVCPRGPEQKPR
jgi:hypothetical protein